MLSNLIGRLIEQREALRQRFTTAQPFDFNYHPQTLWHRRLNLIYFLNDEWRDGWGGLLEFHSNPWDPETNTVERALPIRNRAVIFETSELSWHGF